MAYFEVNYALKEFNFVRGIEKYCTSAVETTQEN